MSSPTAQQHHDEVLGALSALVRETGISPERGELVRADRRSEFEYFGLRTPDRRRRVAAGFSFTDEDAASVLAAWDGIWNLADNGDVMSAVLDFYRRRIGSRRWTADDSAKLWLTAVGWIERIDNWAHADDLARLYSSALADQAELVYPTLEERSRSDNEWQRRIAMVSLIHYSGKNAVFLPIEPSLRVLSNCAGDRRETACAPRSLSSGRLRFRFQVLFQQPSCAYASTCRRRLGDHRYRRHWLAERSARCSLPSRRGDKGKR